MNGRISRGSGAIFLSVAGFSVLLLYLGILRAGDLPPYEVYFLSLLLIVFPVLLFVGGLSSERSATVGLVVFSCAVNLMYPLLTRFDITYDADSVYMYQLVTLILQQGHWQPGTGTGIAVGYSLYPILPVFISTLSLLTSLPLSVSVLWCLAPARAIAMPVLMVGFFRKYLSREASIVATFTFLTAPLLHHTANEAMAILFVIALLYLQARTHPIGRGLSITIPLLVVVLTMNHHLSSFFIVAWIWMVFAARRLGKSIAKSLRSEIDGTRVEVALPAMATLSFLGWTAYVSYEVIGDWWIGLAASLSQLLYGLPTEYVPALQRFAPYELLIIYADMLLLASTTLYGLWIYVRRQRRLSAVIIGGFLLAVSLVISGVALRATDVYPLFNRVFTFSYIGFVPLSALCVLGRRFRRTLGPLVLIVFVIGGSLVVTYSPRMYYHEPLGTTYLGPVRTEEFYTGTWFRAHSVQPSSIFGDRRSYEILGGFGDSQIPYWDSRIFNSSSSENEVAEIMRIEDIHYVALHRWMFLYPTFDFDTPLGYQQAYKFANMPQLLRVYDDGSYWIYYW